MSTLTAPHSSVPGVWGDGRWAATVFFKLASIRREELTRVLPELLVIIQMEPVTCKGTRRRTKETCSPIAAHACVRLRTTEDSNEGSIKEREDKRTAEEKTGEERE